MGKHRLLAMKVVLPESEKSKALERAKKFGVVKDDDKQKLRAVKFGAYHPDLEADKRKQREMRFSSRPVDEATTVKQRAERFGVSNPNLDQERKKKRVERFANPPPALKPDDPSE